MGESIDSPKNPRIKEAARLRERRARKLSGLILIDGARELRRALEAGVRVIEAFVCFKLATSADAGKAIDALRNANANIIETSEAALAKLQFGDRDDGIVAVVERPAVTLASLTLPANPLIVVIESVEKPGNLGALMRSADAVGADAVIAADAQGDIYGPNSIRASMGAIFTVPLVETSSADAFEWLASKEIQIVTATPAAAETYVDVDYRRGTAIVLGAESTGVGDTWMSSRCRRVRVPMRGRVDSLNVSTTAAILLFEALRQRTQKT